MFFQPPDEEQEQDCSKVTSKTVKSKSRQKKLRRKNRLKAIRKKQKKKQKVSVLPLPSAPTLPRLPSVPTIPITMSTWAEDFTKASTWQLKNELAYWKSKAKALEYENNILHRTIRQNSIVKDARMKIPNNTSDEFQVEQDLTDSEDEEDIDDEAEPESEVSVQDQFEVSEEYIQFLRDNQVYRDFAKQERDRLRAKNDKDKQDIELMEAGPAENTEDPKEELKKLYGDSWERISALEMSLTTQFLTLRDQENPTYWPNVPFNLMY